MRVRFYDVRMERVHRRDPAEATGQNGGDGD